jgi:hypothetical protein
MSGSLTNESISDDRGEVEASLVVCLPLMEKEMEKRDWNEHCSRVRRCLRYESFVDICNVSFG